ncbi:spermatogenesis-associated protein 20-like isoform X1 [Branchiostoma floridae]|uniref:Spermatogenesis-associated protein 20-like isoform X1 n=2 Tax=Branchiostoma floridae TaxID=7739 RepID=A0A9J7N7J1_BRAFL|nr:spermatogenesis-associated protein 20-like isoform X1 [Branchiostoma floridae]
MSLACRVLSACGRARLQKFCKISGISSISAYNRLVIPIASQNSVVFRQTPLTAVRTMATGGASSSGSRKGGKHKNRLAEEKSPYLLQHCHNPVDWYPWGEDAFKKAKKENKPIFLSVGYSTCHWCHVMERESFESEEVGKIMNEHFVNVKVDREERPDVDKVYMSFIQATSGGGGWPMSVWLTPDLKPIAGGTYFPPKDHMGRPGFSTILTRISEQWKNNKDKLIQQGNMVIDALKELSVSAVDSTATLPGQESVKKCLDQLDNSYDEEFGGFGHAPKFPQPVNFNFLFRVWSSMKGTPEAQRALDMALETLRFMAKGGMYDHIGQGFHRYSTDRTWHVPHFEKMLYDQGQLAVAYCDAYQITKDPIFADIARDILLYVSRDLSDRQGGFYSAEDADSLPNPGHKTKKEGAFCVWEADEIRNLLGEKLPHYDDMTFADLFAKHYNINRSGNVAFDQDPHGELAGKNVLIVRGSVENTAKAFGLEAAQVEEVLGKCRDILFKVRRKRPPPHRDDKMITAWNGLMISGFARAAQVLGEAQYLDRAVKAAKFVRKKMYDDSTGKLLRSCYHDPEMDRVTQIANPIDGFADDYAFLIRGLLDLYEASYNEEWVEWAAQLQRKQDELFWDSEGLAYFTVSGADPSVLIRMKEDQDGAEPSANSVSAGNLLRLASFHDDEGWRNKSVQLMTAFGARLAAIPLALPEMVSALIFYQQTPKQIIIAGNPRDRDTKALLQCVHSSFNPNKILIIADGKEHGYLYEKLKVLSTLKKVDGKATAYVCENYACSLPVNTVLELDELLSK